MQSFTTPAFELQRLMPRLSRELSKIAGGMLRGGVRDPLLATSDLVQETMVRLCDQQRVTWQSSEHFLGTAALLMRRALLDQKKQRRTQKRGEGVVPTPLDLVPVAAEDDLSLGLLEEALQQLEREDPDQAKLVNLRYFLGLSVQQIARVTALSPRTVYRELETARLRLTRIIRKGAC